MMTEEQKDIKLSVSKAKTFLDCKKKYEFAYILKFPRKEWDFHTFGKFCHSVLERFHKEYIDGCLLPYHVTMTDVYRKAMKEYSANMTKEMREECWDIVNRYLRIVSVDKSKKAVNNVTACEKDFKLVLNGSYGNILLNGSIDRVQTDDDGVVHVCDYKTTKNKKYLENDNFQLLAYAYVLVRENPDIEKVRGSYILLRHDFEPILFEFSRDQIMAVEPKLISYADKMIQETNFQATPSALCKFCDYLSSCEEGKKKVSPKLIYGETSWT